MILAKVVGTIVATRKNEYLIGNKFLLIEPFDLMEQSGNKLVAIDNLGAGIGDTVLVALGSAARIGCDMEKAPVDAAIVGIVDSGLGQE